MSKVNKKVSCIKHIADKREEKAETVEEDRR